MECVITIALVVLVYWLVSSKRRDRSRQVPGAIDQEPQKFAQNSAHTSVASNDTSFTPADRTPQIPTRTSTHERSEKKQEARQPSIPTDFWLEPTNLKPPKYLKGVYCLAYRIGRSQDDSWTVRINEFKESRNDSVDKAEAVMRASAKSLFRRIGIQASDTIVIPALGSKEEKADRTSRNSRLASAIADGAGATFHWTCLSKDPHPSLHTQYGAPARDAALAEANYRAVTLECNNVLIVDDIITRGTTLDTIAEAVRKANPRVSIYGFALGRHTGVDYLHVSMSEANAGVPQALATLWDRTKSAPNLHATT